MIGGFTLFWWRMRPDAILVIVIATPLLACAWYLVSRPLSLAHWLTGLALGLKTPEWTSDGKTIGRHMINHVVLDLVTAFAARSATRV